MSDIAIHESWLPWVREELSHPTMQNLKHKIQQEIQQGKQIFPRPSQWFTAFNTTPLQDIRVVILGQDPYHGPGQAHGLSFSVPDGVELPPSLKNIFKELQQEGLLSHMPSTGNLVSRAKQGVFLLNSILTVQAGQAGSHRGRGWEQFTDHVISVINEQCHHVVFLLRGSYARSKRVFVDSSQHCIIETVHPSPLSAYRGFLGSDCFIECNAYLREHHGSGIRWDSVL